MADRAYPKDLTGLRFGRLTVVKGLGLRPHGRKGRRRTTWACVCDCGERIERPRYALTTGHTQSCGCLKRDEPSRLRHGHAHAGKRSKTYATWVAMRRRSYGGQVIPFASRWRSFEVFLSDMGERPEGTTLDRIDTKKGYSPDNCRWTDRTTQARNRRITKMITFRGETKPLAQWAEELGMKYSTLNMRLARGWPIERALLEPITAASS